MTGDPMIREHWKPEPDQHDYPAAADFLSLVFPDPAVTTMVVAAPLRSSTARPMMLRSDNLTGLLFASTRYAADLMSPGPIGGPTAPPALPSGADLRLHRHRGLDPTQPRSGFAL